MDVGHHNCRDYYLKPEDTLAQTVKPGSIASLLASRSVQVSQKSPLNGPSRRPPAFPFLQLPLELRIHVYTYLLPRTEEQRESLNPWKAITSKRLPPTHHNLPSAVLQELLAKPASGTSGAVRDWVTWRRGQTTLLAVCRQFHDECARIMYGESTFVVFVAYDAITFRFRWLLPNGLTPSRTYEFLELIPSRYLKLIKRLVVTVDHVDSYTGQIKYNVGGKGLTHGLKWQVATLVQAVRTAPEQDLAIDEAPAQGLRRLSVRLLNGNDHLDADKRNMVKARETSLTGTEEVQTVLEPLVRLEGLVSLEVTGAVTDAFVTLLRAQTMTHT